MPGARSGPRKPRPFGLCALLLVLLRPSLRDKQQQGRTGVTPQAWAQEQRKQLVGLGRGTAGLAHSRVPAHTGWSQALWRAPCGSFADRRERPVGGSPDPPFAANAPGTGPRSLCRDVPQAAQLRSHGPLRSPHAAHMRLLPGPRPPRATPHQPLGSCRCSLLLLPPFLLLTCHL